MTPHLFPLKYFLSYFSQFFFSASSIVLPCLYPSKCSIPWITKKLKNWSKVFPKFLASFFIIAGQRIISPIFLRSGKDKILVGLFLFLYFLFNSLDFFSSTHATEREYFFPKMSFFITRKSLSILLGHHFAEFF